jgi:hypothetical protein
MFMSYNKNWLDILAEDLANAELKIKIGTINDQFIRREITIHAAKNCLPIGEIESLYCINDAGEDSTKEFTENLKEKFSNPEYWIKKMCSARLKEPYYHQWADEIASTLPEFKLIPFQGDDSVEN